MQAWVTGVGDDTQRTTPEQLLSPTNIVQVAAGEYHTVLVDGSGLVRASMLVLSVACRREPEWYLCVCGLASFAVLFASRVVCWGVWESLSRAWKDSLHRTPL